MTPLARMRNSRNEWKRKNGEKRKIINKMKRQAAALKEQIEKKTNEYLSCQAELLSKKNPNRDPFKDLEEEIKKLDKQIQKERKEQQQYDENLRQLEQENDTLRREKDALQQENEKLKKMHNSTGLLEEEPITKLFVQALCVYLVTTCGISFRAIPKVLQGLIDVGLLKPQFWIPHFTSIVNWTTRVGIYLLSQVKPIEEEWIAIIDLSVDKGTRKTIVILRVLLSALESRGKAITLDDSEVIFMKTVESSTGEVIAECLEEAFSVAGRPIAIIKDGGSDLKKGTTLYSEKNSCKISLAILADLGHIVANALKAEFAKLSSFKRLMTLIYGGAKRICQTEAAIFLPPQLRSKGRFQSISRIAAWCLWILDLMAVPGQTQHDSIVAVLRKAFPKVPCLRLFIEKFAMTCTVVNKLQMLLKNQGLNQETYQAGLAILAELPETSHTRKTLTEWMNKHIRLHCLMSIGQTPLLISSDVIESLIGQLKLVLARSPTGELTRLTYMLPTLCGNLTIGSIMHALKETTHDDLTVKGSNVIPITLLQKRRRLHHLLKQQVMVPKMSQIILTS